MNTLTNICYLNPRNDVAFKKIFGDIKNKEILIHFLNDVLGKEKSIVNVTIVNPAQLPEIEGSKESLLDVLCTDQDDNQYIVEMQVSGKRGFEKRAQYYAAKAYCQQAKKGDNYYHLKEIIFLAILDFVMFPKSAQYKHVHKIFDEKDFTHHLTDFSFTFIELPKFNKEDPETLETYQEKWCYFFKNASDPVSMYQFMKTLKDEDVIHKAYEVLETHHWTPTELQYYERMEKMNKDMRAREGFIIDKTEARVKAEMEEKVKKAEAKAAEAEAHLKNIVQHMNQKGASIEEIVQITGASLEKIKPLL